MKKLLSFLLLGVLATTYGCKKKDKTVEPEPEVSFATVKTEMLNDLVNKTIIPQYVDLQSKLANLNAAIITFNAKPTEANLGVARQAWLSARERWQQCEGMPLGPIIKNNYRTMMDASPVDYTQIDALLTGTSPLEVSDIEALPGTLRGFHPVEYVLWGRDSLKEAAEITSREQKYLSSLCGDLFNNATRLHNSWQPEGGNYQLQVLQIATESDIYATYQDALLDVVASMAKICKEVDTDKIEKPLIALDSNMTESPFSHNSITDFRNNIIGARNAYMCSYREGRSMSSLVAFNNAPLDNQIRQQFETTINAFNSITTTFEIAIHTQGPELLAIQAELEKLEILLREQLSGYIIQYVRD